MSKRMHSIPRRSMVSNKIHTRDIYLDTADLDRYVEGNVLIQDAFPYLSAEDREFIKTGITPEEWNDLFANHEE